MGDPAVAAYTDPALDLTGPWSRKTGEAVEFTVLPWAEYFPALTEALESGAGKYDVVMIAGHLWLQDFVSRGFLLPLEGIRGAVDRYGAFEDILPKVRAELAVGEEIYLIPSFTDGHILFYQKDPVERVLGGPLPEVLTVSEFTAAAEQLALASGKPGETLVMKAHESEIFLDWLPHYAEGGQNLFGPGLEPRFNSPRGVEALERYASLKRLALPVSLRAGNEEVCEALRTGSCLMGVSWGGQARFIASPEALDRGMGFATFREPWNVTWGFAVPRGAEWRESLADFLGFLASPEVDRQVGARAGSPVRDSSYRGEVLPWYPVQRTMVELSRPLPSFRGSGEVYGLFYKWIYRAFSGETAAAAALSGLDREVREALASRS